MPTNTHDEPERVDLKSLDVAEEKRQELLRLFPEARTEGGKVDFDRLKLALGESVDVGRERYGMNWPGKAECFRAIQSPSMATLRPMREESVNWDTTENLIIEGDNLEVLKLLQKAYLGKVKMIYIDPPYNTGSDFIYPDNYSESLQTYLEYTGQVDSQGKKFGTNAETDGRFHSKWLNMMYPRLTLARNLLRDDGTIFISIDDKEVRDLRSACDEIFGESNFVATIIWEKKYAPQNDAKFLSDNHEFILLYARNKATWRPFLLPRSAEANARYRNPDNDARGVWKPGDLLRMEHRDNSVYAITSPTGRRWVPESGTSWRHPEDEMQQLIASNQVWFGPDGNSKPSRKRFLNDVQQGVVPETIWTYDECGHNQEGTQVFKAFFAGTDVEFTNPKPPRLIRRMLQIATAPGASDIVLDFFAGTGSTAQAVLEQNANDGGNRPFVLVQLPEPLAANTSGIKTIADITRARARKVIESQLSKSELPLVAPTSPVGFRAFSLAGSNFVPWETDDLLGPKDFEQQLDLHVHHIRTDRKSEDLLFEILLKEGFAPAVRIETRQAAGKSAYAVADGLMLICLDHDLSLSAIRAMAELMPQRVVCLDEGFSGNDQLKANAVQIFKSKNIVFRTV